MSFEAHDHPISELLSKAVFEIPRNQRRYVWNKTNWQELFEDILFSAKYESNAHFIGSIVLKDQGKQDGLSCFTIIDGQQRLTTITVVLVAIMKLFNERKMKNDFLGTVDYIQAKDNRNQRVSMLSSEYHLSISALVDAVINLADDDKTTINSFVDSHILSKQKDKSIGEALKFFYKLISDEIEKAENQDEMLLKIRDSVINMILVSIVSSSEEDSYTIFEILNARGQELESYELLKNYIMRYIQPVGKRDVAKAKWEDMENQLGAWIKKFISHYVKHKFKIVSTEKESDYRIIQKFTRGTDINHLLDDIKLKSEYYLRFISPEKEGDKKNCKDFEYHIFKFFKKNRQEQFRPLILSLMHQNELGNLSDKLYEQAIKFIYNFFVCYTIIGEEQSNKLQDIVNKYAVLLENEFSDKNFIEFAKALKAKIPSYDWFEKSFVNLGWSNISEMFRGDKNKKRVQITLEVLEKYISQQFDDKEFTIEHILPDSEGEKNAHIGNLIPLEERLNGRCGNKELHEKFNIYQDSSFKLARGIVERYTHQEFDPESRTKFLAKLVYNNILELKQLDYTEI